MNPGVGFHAEHFIGWKHEAICTAGNNNPLATELAYNMILDGRQGTHWQQGTQDKFSTSEELITNPSANEKLRYCFLKRLRDLNSCNGILSFGLHPIGLPSIGLHPLNGLWSFEQYYRKKNWNSKYLCKLSKRYDQEHPDLNIQYWML